MKPDPTPMSIRIAAETVALDRIKIEPINNMNGKDFITIKVFSFLSSEKNIENKFVKQAVKQLTNDINYHLENYKDCVFKPFSLRGKIRRGFFFSYMDMGYIIDYKK